MTTNKKITIILGILIVAALVIFSLSRSVSNKSQPLSLEKEETKKVLKIGFMAPLSGDAASYGESIKRGVELALKDADLDNIELVVEDSKCDGKTAVTAINKLISIDKVIAIVGEVCSGATLAAAPVAEDNQVILISPASTSPRLSEAGDYIFRTVPSDVLQGKFGAQLVYNDGFSKLAILYSNEEYGVGFKEVLAKNFTELGGEVVAEEAFERGSIDLRTQLTKIKSAVPSAIYLISNSPDSAVAALKQITELGIKTQIYGSEGLKSEDIITSAGQAAEGLILTSVSSGTSNFIEKHKKEYNREPGPFAAQGYDALTSLVLAIKSGATDGPAIKEALKTVEFAGASGKIKFNEAGDIIAGNYNVFEVRDGALTLQTQ